MSAAAPARKDASMRQRAAARGVDGVTLLILPAVLLMLVFFLYPFAYGFVLAFMPAKGGWAANYLAFFSDPYLYNTIGTTLRLAIPVTVFSLILAVPIALKVRLMRRQRLLTTVLVIPITLGTVLVAEGLLNYLGPQGWFNRTLMALHLIDRPVRLVHDYWGVFASLMITGFPFTFLLTLSYLSGIDPRLEEAAATLGAGPSRRFLYVILPLLASGLVINFCLSFVQSFSVFPSAVLVGAPAGETRVISIAAYQAAYEQLDASMGSAIAIIMAVVQLIAVGAVLGLRQALYRGATSGGKG
jgi:putative spermidine/putrescine transport system permease protein